MAHYPPNVGIVAIDVYFPRTFVSQTELEKFDNAGAGKYTTGLGQQNMAFTTDREDINSICLTVVTSLLEKYKIPLQSIGRLEVGTETLLDKSKSVKSVLMQLFQQSGNTNIEGVDTYNACYGGTNALFNALNWVESSAWDGRYALVVAGDVAVYAAGNARPTGGCGVVAMLVGPNAPIIAERGLRGSHMEHSYDFYKPRPDVEYPTVDGALSITCYYRALDNSYRHFKQAWARSNPGVRFDHTKFDYMVFHSPFNKLVQKSFGRLLYLDFVDNPDDKLYADVQAFRNMSLEKSYTDKDLEAAFLKKSKELYDQKVSTSTLLQRECGNMYCGSVYGGLCGLLSEKADDLVNKRILMFSYGSGLASSLFSLRVVGTIKSIAEHLNVRQRLAQRTAISPADFTRILDMREQKYGKCGYKAEAPIDNLFPGTYYLVEVDSKYRRSYQRAPGHYRKSSL